MSKPDDIPQDVWDRATERAALWFELLNSDATRFLMVNDFAREILAAEEREREACAFAALEQTKAPAQRSVKDRWVEEIGQNIAAAIRARQ